MKIKFTYPLIIIIAGMCFSLYLQFLLPQDTYFNGDAGLKSLLAQQFASGNLQADIQQTSLDWVRSLWREGFYPYEEPFAYYLGQKYYITFPYTFPLVTAPFFALFGYRGLYIIPLVSTWAIWFIFYLACIRSKLNYFLTSVGLVSLIFASPLTIYSGMYWEHTLAVMLCFLGLFLWFFPKDKEKVSQSNSILAGIAIGLSVWFRPEFLPLVLLVIGTVVLLRLMSLPKLAIWQQKLNSANWEYLSSNYSFFLASLLVTVALFFVCNKLIYNHPLGIHAMQVVEKGSIVQRSIEAWNKLQQLLVFLFRYFPLTYFLLAYPSIALIVENRTNRRRNLILTASYLCACLLLFLIAIAINNRSSDLFVTHTPPIFLLLLYGILLSLNRQKLEINASIVFFYLFCFAFILGVAILVPAGTEGFKVVGGKQWGARFLLILMPMFSLFAIYLLSHLQNNYEDKLLRYGTISIVGLILAFGIAKNTFAASIYLQKEHQGYLPAIEFLRQQNKENIIVTSYQFVGQILEPALSRDKIFFLAETSKDLTKLAAGLQQAKQNNFLYICYHKRKCTPPEDKPENLQFDDNNKRFQVTLSSRGKKGVYPIYLGEIKPIAKS